MALYDPNQEPKLSANQKWFLAQTAEAQQRRQNLQKLADGLSCLPKRYGRFNMAYFYKKRFASLKKFHSYFTEQEEVPCGTVACALGHGPMMGIKRDDSEHYAYWGTYAKKFTIDHHELEYIFGGGWSHSDNTPHGAAKRIYWFLQNSAEMKNNKKFTILMRGFSSVVERRHYANQLPVNAYGDPQ